MGLGDTLKSGIKRILRGPLRIGGGGPFEPIEAGGLRVECHCAWREEAGLLSAWEKLLAATPSAITFQSPTWQQGVHQFFVSAGKARLITVHKHDELIAVLPLHLTAAGGLETSGAAVSDYLDPLLKPADEEPAWHAILTFLRAQLDHSANRIILPNLRESAPCRAILPRIAGDEGFAVEEAKEDEVVVRIAIPATWDDYLKALPKDERIEFRRRLKKAEAEAGARLAICDDESAFAPALSQAIDLMAARGGEKGEAIDKFVRPLLMAVAPQLRREGRAKLYQLIIKDTVAGALLIFPSADGPMVYNTGFDLTHRVWGPGIIGYLMVMREAMAAGAKTFDLLRGREEYKHRLGGMEHPLYRLMLRAK